ncbi:MAG: hypothetical protein MUF03_04785 [Rubrivivax sp.]|jgi:hypothetical protein|nr:hypothetical protein [Rubrivivax sp.]
MPLKPANRLGVHPGLQQRDFECIAQGGFGDGLNAYAHSMAWFDGRLYVGTTRGNFPFMKARLPIGLATWPVECPEDPYSLDMRAEIWRYDPVGGDWERVLKSPVIKGSDGRPIPRELGLRGMLVHQGPSDPKPALYVSTWSPARGPGPLILRSLDGRHFEPTCEPGLYGLPVTTIRTICSFKGRMYTTPAGSRGGNPNVSAHSVVYESADPARGGWEPVSDFGFGDSGNKTVFEMCAFGDHLYVGTFNLEGYQVWRSTCEGEKPYRWERLIERGAYRGKLNQCTLSMLPFGGALYIGSGIQGGGIDRGNRVGPAPPELVRLWPDGSWDLLVGESRDTPAGFKPCLSGWLPGFDNFFNGYFWRMEAHDGWLYLGTFEWSSVLGYANREHWPEPFAHIVDHLGPQTMLQRQSGFDLYRSRDGENWVPVTTSGMGNGYNMGLRNIVSTPHGLFLGTANPYGPKVMPIGGDRYVPNPRGGCEIWFARAGAPG